MTPPSAERRVRIRPPISIALVGLVTLLTTGTGATLGALAWREKLAGSRALVDNAMARAARMTADHAAAFLRHAESVGAGGSVRPGPQHAAARRRDPDRLHPDVGPAGLLSGLSERLGPERMIGLLNRYLGRMTPVILQHRGTINEFIAEPDRVRIERLVDRGVAGRDPA